jgi:hypothetical protein
VSEKEHPAATAGRYLRAAGSAIQKELERRAAESEERKQAEAAGATATAQPQATPQTAPKPAAAPPPQATPGAGTPGTAAAGEASTTAAAERRAARQKPPLRPNRFLDRTFWIVFVVALIALALSGLQIQMLAPDSSQGWLRVILGVPLVVAAILVLTNWHRANERIVARIFKMWGLDAPTTKSGRFARRFAKDALTLVGILLLAVAAFQLLSAVVN